MLKKTISLIITLVLFSIIVWFYYLYVSSLREPSNKITASVSKELDVVNKEQIELQTVFFVPQTGVGEHINHLNVDNLEDFDLYTDSKFVSALTSKGYPVKSVDFSNSDLYTTYKEMSANSIVIIPVTEASFRLKTLVVDNQYFWDLDNQDELDKYPLQVDIPVNKAIANYNINKKVSYLAGGEVIPARDVLHRRIETGTDPYYNFANVKPLFDDADIASTIMENPIAGDGDADCGYGCMRFLGAEDFKYSLADIGIDVVSFGNHVGDFSEWALEDTLNSIDEVGIAHTGASLNNQSEASQGAILEINGMTFGFLGYEDVATYYWATDTRWGSARATYVDENGLRHVDEDKVRNDINNLKDQVDYIVVMISWGGREYVNYSSTIQEELGHFLVDNGVDLIVGTHQHWTSQIDYYQDAPIFYGLGNFLFDQTHTEETRQGAIVNFYFYDKKLVSYKIVPLITWGYHQMAQIEDLYNSGEIKERYNLYQPYVLADTDPVYWEIIDRMMEYSEI